MKSCIMRHFIWGFTVCQNLHLGVTNIQRVNAHVTSSIGLIKFKYWSYQVLAYLFSCPYQVLALSYFMSLSPGHVAQWVTCLAADTCLTADQGVASLILARSHTFMEIDHEIISTVIVLPSTDLRRVVVSYKRKYVHEVLVNC